MIFDVKEWSKINCHPKKEICSQKIETFQRHLVAEPVDVHFLSESEQNGTCHLHHVCKTILALKHPDLPVLSLVSKCSTANNPHHLPKHSH
jgi:hypothetical protein